MVEPAPSHDNTPAFATYSILEGTQPTDRINQRPAYGLCIYDVTQDASPARAEQMARAIFERTKAYRGRPDSDPGRIEVVALPCPKPEVQSSPAGRELAEDCIQHFEEERASRLAMEDGALARSWYLPDRLSDEWYAMGIVVISRVTDRWEEGLDWIERHYDGNSTIISRKDAYNSWFETCLLVKWQPREETWRAYEEPIAPEQRVTVSVYRLENLRTTAHELLYLGVVTFHEHFLRDGILDLEPTQARDKGL